MQRHRFIPSPAFVLSLVALFVALGGTSYAAMTALPANSVGTAQLKNSAVTNVKIANSAVTGAKIADSAVTGPKILNGTITAADISSSALGAARVVGAAGQPAYENSWVAAGAGDEGVKFYKDPWGIVHLQGNASHTGPVSNTIFTLPAGYRPAGSIYFAAYGASGTAAYIQITSAGAVIETGVPQTYVGLSNISFRAGL